MSRRAAVYGLQLRRGCFEYGGRTSSLVASLLLFAAKKHGGGADEALDFLSTVTGTFTKMLDDDLSLTVSYDLADDSRVPISFVTG